MITRNVVKYTAVCIDFSIDMWASGSRSPILAGSSNLACSSNLESLMLTRTFIWTCMWHHLHALSTHVDASSKPNKNIKKHTYLYTYLYLKLDIIVYIWYWFFNLPTGIVNSQKLATGFHVLSHGNAHSWTYGYLTLILMDRTYILQNQQRWMAIILIIDWTGLQRKNSTHYHCLLVIALPHS